MNVKFKLCISLASLIWVVLNYFLCVKWLGGPSHKVNSISGSISYLILLLSFFAIWKNVKITLILWLVGYLTLFIYLSKITEFGFLRDAIIATCLSAINLALLLVLVRSTNKKPASKGGF